MQYTRLMNPEVPLRIVHIYLKFWLILAHLIGYCSSFWLFLISFMGYCSPFWSILAYSIAIAHQFGRFLPVSWPIVHHFGLVWSISWSIAHRIEVPMEFPGLMNTEVLLWVVHQHSQFLVIL